MPSLVILRNKRNEFQNGHEHVHVCDHFDLLSEDIPVLSNVAWIPSFTQRLVFFEVNVGVNPVKKISHELIW